MFSSDRSPPLPAELPDARASAPLRATWRNLPYGSDVGEAYFRWRAAMGRWASHEQLRDDRMEAYAPLVLAGRYQTTYLVRATTPGSFLAPPARVEEVEHPETFGQAAADRIVVEEVEP